MVNVKMLKGKMVEKDLTVEKLSDNIGVNKSTLYRKLNAGGDVLTIREVNLIVSALGLTDAEANAIFFAKSVA